MASVQTGMRGGMVFDIQRWSLHDGPGIRTIVFLKGCPLRCTWCCNPESQAPSTELAFFADKCISCNRCIELCPHGAISAAEGRLLTDWSVCQRKCYNTAVSPFPCTAKCYSKARRAIGGIMSVDEVMTEVMKDSGIYGQSDGGMTLSGGEPMSQCDFARDLAQAAKENWLKVAMETCGFASWSSYQAVLPFVDFLFLDIKYFDQKRHQQLTGQINELILENAPRIADYMRQKGGKMVVRIPVIPGLTDCADVEKIAGFVSTRMPGVETLELMPYHRLGRGKYGDIGRQYDLADLQPPKEEQIQPFREIVSQHGLALRYS